MVVVVLVMMMLVMMMTQAMLVMLRLLRVCLGGWPRDFSKLAANEI